MKSEPKSGNSASERLARAILIPGLSLSLDDDPRGAIDAARTVLRRAGVSERASFALCKRSVDARVRGGVRTVRFVYSVLATFEERVRISERTAAALLKSKARIIDEDDTPVVVKGSAPMEERPLVVGMGPAGLFCALMLAEEGYRPILIDRGDDVRRRVETNERFQKTGVLDTESNVQFGAGGAGTFSDGKLITRISDPSCAYVLRRFVDCGAPEEILTDARPHIGTDLLVGVVERLLQRIEALGGTVLYRTRLDAIGNAQSEHLLSAKTTGGEISCGALVLALGHSARDTQRMLMRLGFPTVAKPFSVGVRAEHLQSEIDRAMYGDYAGHPRLGHAEYNLSDTTGDRGVYTFCMCPGGTVVAAASEEGGVVVNGMSCHARDGENAVAAVAVSIRTEDFGNTPENAMEFQRVLEEKAFQMGGGGYAAPIQTLGDFLDGASLHTPQKVTPTYSRGAVTLSRLDTLFPSPVTETLRRGFVSFGKKLRGYDDRETVLTGVETRTSSPVRILRTETMTAVGFPLVYPIGEGAGYAGGITSAAADGIRAALALMRRFAPFEG
ncbi:MAG: hypothetical protein J6B77_06245 [Clostridia bacterium]|nr:hypothetical protein [Clostridia bacterium]